MSTVPTRIDVALTSLSVLLILMVGGAVNEGHREQAFRQACRNNLAYLGKAMVVYAHDYVDELPKAGGMTNEWVPTLPDWMAASRRQAWALSRDGRSLRGKTTTTSSLYLLVKYAEVTPGRFVCPSEPHTREFRMRDAQEEIPRGFAFIDAWDFGGRYDDHNNPSRHCSYAYQMSFDDEALTLAHPLEMAVAADRNPWIDPNRVNDGALGWSRFVSAIAGPRDEERLRIGNSDAHQRFG